LLQVTRTSNLNRVGTKQCYPISEFRLRGATERIEDLKEDDRNTRRKENTRFLHSSL
jgi:hypothetical protein